MFSVAEITDASLVAELTSASLVAELTSASLVAELTNASLVAGLACVSLVAEPMQRKGNGKSKEGNGKSKEGNGKSKEGNGKSKEGNGKSVQVPNPVYVGVSLSLVPELFARISSIRPKFDALIAAVLEANLLLVLQEGCRHRTIEFLGRLKREVVTEFMSTFGVFLGAKVTLQIDGIGYSPNAIALSCTEETVFGDGATLTERLGPKSIGGPKKAHITIALAPGVSAVSSVETLINPLVTMTLEEVDINDLPPSGFITFPPVSIKGEIFAEYPKVKGV